jgi:hypothetical protein
MSRLPSGKSIIPWVSGLLLAIAMAACGGGGESDLTARPISDADLGTMAVYEVDLPQEFDGFVRTTESGFKTNEQSAEMNFDPADEANDLELFGQVREYVRIYELPPVGGQIPQGEAISLASSARLFEEPSGASDYLEDELADLEGSVGKELGDTTIEEFERFGVSGIGDEAVGVRTTVMSPDDGSERLTYATQVSFRRGRLLLSIAVVRTDDEDVSAELKDLARDLDERIQVVLETTLMASPTVTQ